jgi:hypothetical protein
MAKSSDALIRDIAKLFVRYELSEWRPVLDSLRMGGEAQRQIADAIEAISAVRPPRKPKAAPRRSNKEALISGDDILASTPEPRRGALEDLVVALVKKRVLPRAVDLREAHLAVGGKGALPKERQQAVRALIAFLADLSDDRFSAALESIWHGTSIPKSDLQHDYRRWFSMIYGSKDM